MRIYIRCSRAMHVILIPRGVPGQKTVYFYPSVERVCDSETEGIPISR